MYTSAIRTVLLDAMPLDYASLHSAFPGDTGASEVSARIAAGWQPASVDKRTAVAAPLAFSLAEGESAAWIGWWDAPVGGTLLAYGALGGAEREYSVDRGQNRILCKGHGFTNSQPIVFYAGTTTPCVEGTTYYVRDALADSFRVAQIAGGGALTLTGDGSGMRVLSPINPIAAVSGGLILRVQSTTVRWTHNLPPIWQAIGEIQFTLGVPSTFDLSAYATDPDGEDIDFMRLSGALPLGVSLNAETGLLTWDGIGNGTTGFTTAVFGADDGK